MFDKGDKVVINSMVKECPGTGCPCKTKKCVDVVERCEDRDNGQYYIVTLKNSGKKYDSRDLTASDSKLSDRELVDLARQQ